MKVPVKPSGRRALPFYWWRRYQTHKSLPYKSTLLDKIRNGDFDYSPFFEQAKWELHWMKEEQEEFIHNYQGKEPEQDSLYSDIERRARKRYNRLYEDGMKDEFDRMDRLVNDFKKYFKIPKDTIKEEMENFDGTIEELFLFLRKDLVI